MTDQPKMQCPKCKAEYDDFDGFGVLYCEQCGYRDHDLHSYRCSYDNNGVCYYHGEEISPTPSKKAVQQFREWMEEEK